MLYNFSNFCPNSQTMKHNNQIHSVRKFRKYWQRYVKTWFNQPARKKSRRVARDKKVPSRELGPRDSLLYFVWLPRSC